LPPLCHDRHRSPRNSATNAVRGATLTIDEPVSPIGSFTDPEYAQVGLTEAKAHEARDVITATVRFDTTTRTIIDGRTDGFCKLIVDRTTATILGCHVVGDRSLCPTAADLLLHLGNPFTSPDRSSLATIECVVR
jgi:pyruvate/2-oxoglutarate dehydrogenase complex dihydrolipoamide dehydrogenase (E3) component